jgi:SSS family solute:Na+ symporter
MLAGFALVIALSIGLALLSRRGHGAQDARAFFAASGQLGAVFVFFLSVGETYSVLTLLGFPGGIFAHGDGFNSWFFGYILLVAPVLFFLGPWIARAGGLYKAATIADFFGRHFESVVLERVVAIAAVAVLVPVGTMQFIGLKIVLATLAPGAPPLLLAGGTALLAFTYVAIAGLRASAYVALLKDVLMIGSILLVSGVALAGWDQGLVGPPAAAVAPMGAHDRTFAISTILVQSLGFAMLPQTWSLLFSARSGQAIRRAQVAAPLYMAMFPLLACVATYALYHGLHPREPDHVFLATAAALLPTWLLGIVLAGVTLAGLVVLTTVCLATGSLVTRNLLPGLDSRAQQVWAKVITILYLVLSIASAQTKGGVMATMNNLIYFGIIQLLPGFLAAMWFRRAPAIALIGGLLVGYCVAMGLFGFSADLGGLNPGLVGLLPNLLVVALITAWRPRLEGQSLLERLG